MLSGCQLLPLLLLGSVALVENVEVERCAKGFELRLLLHLPSALAAWTQPPRIFLRGEAVGLDPDCLVELGVVVVGLVKLHPCVGENFVAVVDSETRGEDSSDEFSILWRPLTVRGGVGLTGPNLLPGLCVPYIHFSVEIAEPCKADQPAKVTPNDVVLVLLAELEEALIVLGEEDRLCGHESTDNDVELSSVIPGEVVDGTLGSLDLDYFVAGVVEEVESVLTVV